MCLTSENVKWDETSERGPGDTWHFRGIKLHHFLRRNSQGNWSSRNDLLSGYWGIPTLWIVANNAARFSGSNTSSSASRYISLIVFVIWRCISRILFHSESLGASRTSSDLRTFGLILGSFLFSLCYFFSSSWISQFFFRTKSYGASRTSYDLNFFCLPIGVFAFLLSSWWISRFSSMLCHPVHPAPPVTFAHPHYHHP